MQVYVLIGETDYEPSDVLSVHSEFQRAKEELQSQLSGENRYDGYTIETFTVDMPFSPQPKPYSVRR